MKITYFIDFVLSTFKQQNSMIRKKCFPAIVAILVIFTACSSDNSYENYGYNEPTIYSSSDKVLFSEIMFFIKPYVEENGQRMFVVTDTLHNISVKINNRRQFYSQSFPLDTLHITQKKTIGSFRATAEDIHYPVIVNVRTNPDTFDKAGQYADLLNNYFTLLPGVYVCQIESFDIRTISGAFKTIYTPSLSFP